MSVVELRALLERSHGLRFDELTDQRLYRALAEVAPGSGASVGVRAEEALSDPRLQQELLDRITLQESAFFRDPPVFADLASRLLPAAIRAAAGGPLTVWSAGCANGQEAWSLAMLLTELGAPRFEVVASDLSAAATARCAAGVYSDRELRGLDAGRRERFLVRAGAEWQVGAPLRRHVRVVRHNAATEAPPVPDGGCSLVLCRYVLIYLTPRAAEALLGHIATALARDGRLVIGAAESLWHLTERFSPEALPHAVAYRHRRASDGHGPQAVPPTDDDVPSTQRLPPHAGTQESGPPLRRTAPMTRHADSGPREEPPPEPQDGARLVRDGEAAAARGDLAAAAASFRGAADLDPDDAEALVRLGLVLEAMADAGAVGAYRAAWAAVQRRPPGSLEAALGGFGAAALVRLLTEKLEEGS